MKAILMPVSPAECSVIELGIAIALTSARKPSLKPPFIIYIYETKGNNDGCEKVIGYATCDDVGQKYSRSRCNLYIKDFVKYEEPKDINNMFLACRRKAGTDCSCCIEEGKDTCKAVTKPPKTWCYVETEEGHEFNIIKTISNMFFAQKHLYDRINGDEDND